MKETLEWNRPAEWTYELFFGITVPMKKTLFFCKETQMDFSIVDSVFIYIPLHWEMVSYILVSNPPLIGTNRHPGELKRVIGVMVNNRLKALLFIFKK